MIARTSKGMTRSSSRSPPVRRRGISSASWRRTAPDVGEPGEEQHERDEEDPGAAAAEEEPPRRARRAPRRAGSASRTARTRARAPRRRRRAATGCRTRARPQRRCGRDRDRGEHESRAGRRSGPRTRAGPRARPTSPARIHSSRTFLRSSGAIDGAEPVAERARRRARARSTHAGSPCFFSTNAAKNVEEADDAAQQTHRGARDDDARARAAARARSSVSGGPTCFARGMPSAANDAERRRSRHRRATPTPRPRVLRIAAAIGAATVAAEDADQREPRVGEHELVRAVDDGRARARSWRRDWPFDSTSVANASG